MRKARIRALVSVGLVALASAALLVVVPAAGANAGIQAVGRDQAGAVRIARAMLSQPALLDPATTGWVVTPMSTSPSPRAVSGSLGGLPTHGADLGLLSTGDASWADDPNANPGPPADFQGAPQAGERSHDYSSLPYSTRGSRVFDPTILAVGLQLTPTALQENCLLFDFRFLSEEFPEFVGSDYNDAFVAELDTSSWSVVGSTVNAPRNFAFSPDNKPITVNAAGTTSMARENAAGTTYDGATPLLQAATPAAPGAHRLYLSIFDVYDSHHDSTVLVDNVRWIHVANVTTDCKPGAMPANHRPVAMAHGPYTVHEGSDVTLDSTGSADPEGGALTYAWSQAQPGVGTLATPSAAQPRYAGLDDGTDTVVLEVTDPQGAKGVDSASVAVQNVRPTITAIDGIPSSPVDPGSPVAVTAPFTDPGALDTHTWSVDWGDGSPPTTGSGPVSAMHGYVSGGAYRVAVTVTDDDGGSDTQVSSSDVQVRYAPQVDGGGPYSVSEGSAVQLDGHATDADGTVVSYRWTHGSPASGTLDDPGVQRPLYTGSDDGVETLTVMATDDDGLQASDTAEVAVRNVDPVITAVGAPTSQVQTGQPVHLTAPFGDVGTQDTHTWTVTWGDGTSASTGSGAVAAVHAYADQGTYVPTVTVCDDDGGCDVQQAAAGIVVVANRPPVAEANGPYVVDEGQSVALSSAGSSDPEGGPLTYAWSPVVPAHGQLSDAATANPTFSGIDDGAEALTLTVADAEDATGSDTAQVSVRNVDPTLGAVTVPLAPAALGESTSISTAITDPGVADTHSWSVDWGDGTAPTAGTGSTVSASHLYGAAGVYTVTVTASDDDGGTDTATASDFVVVYDPSGGFVTGGGWISSPAGAHTPADPTDPDLVGKASFGFVSKYQKGATVPTGNTEFQLHAAGLTFRSADYQWLVVSGSRARFKGTGTIDGQPGYAFQVFAGDGGKTAADTFRIKIWRTGDGTVVYDNQAGAGDTADTGTALGGGSIVVH